MRPFAMRAPVCFAQRTANCRGSLSASCWLLVITSCGGTNVPIGDSYPKSTGGVSGGGLNASGGATSHSGGNSSVGGVGAVGGSSALQGGNSSKGGTSSTGGSAGGLGGTRTTGGAPSTGGSANCSCLRGAFVPVCGTDGKSYDATCGDNCVPVSINCRGQCPCTSGTGGSSTGGTTSTTPVGGVTTTGGNATSGGSSAAGGGSGVSCWQNDAPFPAFDKSCTANTDCFVAMHTINCCGSCTAIGLNVSSQVSFNSAESVCPPACTCISGPTTAEDGQAVSAAHPTISVMCTQNQCKTYIP